MTHKKRHQELCAQINDLNKAYYVNNESKVPDAVFDQMFQELKAIEKDHPDLVTPVSPTQRVGFMAARHFTKVTHPFPMLSLGNTFSASELIEWISTIPLQQPVGPGREDILGELKLDGASLELIYEGGLLTKAVTRGDGNIGEDVTLNALGIDGVVRDLRDRPEFVIVVRGEVVVKGKVFDRVNADLVASGKEPYVNQRNYASGALRQKDPEITKARELTFISYSVDFMLPEDDEQHLPSIEKARWWSHDRGFYNSPCQGQHVDAPIEKWEEFLKSQEKIRAEGLWEYDIDGLVFKVNCRRARLAMGFNSREPKWATAYKFPASEGMSVLEDITIQVGRTGQLTPVAEVRPVFIHGTTISRVTLHNIDEIERLGVGIGSDIIIKRAGDVIPKIVSTIGEMPIEKRYKFPTACPCCNSKTYTEVGALGSRTIFCSNQDCPDQVKMHLAHCAGRGVYNILGLGIETIVNLYNLCGFKSKRDHIRLLTLSKADLLTSGLSEHQADKLLGVIEKARKIPLERLISSFGISGVSEGTSENLAAIFGTFESLLHATYEELFEVDKVGKVTANSILEFFDTYKDEGFYDQYIQQLEITNPPPRNSLLKGKSVMITGSMFGDMTRKGITAYYKTLSASVTSSVTSNTHMALFGTKYTGHKLQTAKELKIPYKIFDETGVIEDTVNI
ncbi:putative DNA ligase [Pseudomonas phage Phabio]|uniref:DNA ligase (NAD(+)) n=1 Tax=Pseudomonas phage Phabio TaxID=2006668 RepID=A0A1Y0SYX1_9CAUD|nr:NAD-dependent DNA ligase [Pseudomonas phage Phabio]ARV76963.1 putative DNA ligase [Pseudomonas phage Phabio]